MTPSTTEKTLLGSSCFVFFSQVVRPVRSLPLNSLTTSFGVTGASALSSAGNGATDSARTATAHSGRIRMMTAPGEEGKPRARLLLFVGGGLDVIPFHLRNQPDRERE